MLLHQLEAVGHAEALDAMFTAIQRNQYPTEQQITTLHRLLLRKIIPEQAGVYRNTGVLYHWYTLYTTTCKPSTYPNAGTVYTSTTHVA